MGHFAFFLLCCMLVVAFGCAKQQSAVTPVAEGAVVAKGTKTLEPGEMASVVAGRHNRPGKLEATVTWAESDARIAAFFRHGFPWKHGYARSGSPLVATAYVTAPRTGGMDWTLHLGNTGSQAATVEYVITYKQH
jgi:hypothetical protein